MVRMTRTGRLSRFVAVALLAATVLMLTAPSVASAVPANDNLADARTISGGSVSVGGTTAGATREAGEADHFSPYLGQHSVWYRWTAPVSGSMAVDTCATDINSILAVYTTQLNGSLRRVAANNINAYCGGGLGSKVIFEATAGTTYQIVVADTGGLPGGLQPQEGGFTLNVEPFETKNGALVLVGYQDGTLGKFDPHTARQGPNNRPQPLRSAPSGKAPEVTADGKTVVYAETSLGGEVYSVPMDGSAAPTKLTTNGQDHPNSTTEYPAVSPDGKTVYFQFSSFDENGNPLIEDIYSVPIEGGDITRVTHDDRAHLGLEVTPDGEHFVYYNNGSGTIKIQPVSGGPEATLYDGCPGYCDPAVSPDGSKLAFMQDTGGPTMGAEFALYTMPFSATGGGTPTKVAGSEVYPSQNSYGRLLLDGMAAFSPDGEYLAYSAVWDLDGAECPIGFCGSGVYGETRVIPVGGGNYNSIEWADGYAQQQAVWAPVVVPADATKPTSTAVSSPQASSTGWNNSDVKVTLSATDNDGGSGVEKITYSASGAQTIEQTSAPGSSVEVNLAQEGTTTLTYYATDKSGNVETPKDLTVKIDKTPPKVNAVSPVDGKMGVARDTNLRATFSERTDPTSITKATFKLFRCPSATSTNCTTQVTNVTLGKSADGLGATLNPYGASSTKLSAKTKYQAVVTTGAKDAAGNALDQNATTVGNQPKVWYFTTGS